MKFFLWKYKEVAMYLLFGICTTLVNIIVYAIATRVLALETVAATIAAWVLSVIFAYITNRLWVFESSRHNFKGIIQEFSSFLICRLFSGIFDVLLMWILVDRLGFHDMIIKIGCNIFVIIFNYVVSKFWIFKK